MVAKTVALPNVRKLFIPDPGYTISDWDLDRADLQVVVYEADDKDLKRQLKLGVDTHLMGGILLDGKEPPPEDELIETHPNFPDHKARYKKQRKLSKRFAHGTNYGGSARTMAINCGLTVAMSERLQSRWFALHPGIKDWHTRTLLDLQTKRCVTNKFGYRRFYFDRIEKLLPEALAWIPQSTVALVINTGWEQLETSPTTAALCTRRDIEVLIQVHDSLVIQYKTYLQPTVLPLIKQALQVVVPYDDPLIIPVGCKVSGKSWGDCKEL